MDIVSFEQEGRWYGLFIASVVDLVPTIYLDRLKSISPILFGVVCYQRHGLLAVRLKPLLFPEHGSPARFEPLSPEHSRASLLVVGRGEDVVGLPTERVACILDVQRERTFRRAFGDAEQLSTLQVEYRDREITMIDATRLIRRVRLQLNRTGGMRSAAALSAPC